MLVDFLIVFDPADRGAAKELRAALEDDGSSCLLRATNGAGRDGGANPLSRVMSESGVVVLVVSDRDGATFWTREDMATIRSLLAEGSQANQIALVLVDGMARGELPRDLASATAHDAQPAGWAAVAAALAADARAAARPATVMVGHSMSIVNDIYDDLTTANTGQPAPARDTHDQLYEAAGDDLVVRSHGKVRTRITPAEYQQRLTPGELEDVARIEKAMETNLAEWRRVYPTRAVNAADHAVFARVKKALGEDFKRLQRLLEASGFWLDDHYLSVRDALDSMA